MNPMAVILPLSVLGGLGLIFGVMLSYAGKMFEVTDDPVVSAIREVLPGANCGGCSYTGCDLYAQAVAKGAAKPNMCTVGGAAVTVAISDIMGIKAEVKEKQVACVNCNGDFSKATFRYDYFGMDNCAAAMQLSGGGSKACRYGCLGYGSCVGVCKFDAINIVNGIAVVNKEKCAACGQCVKVCPKHIINFAPYEGRSQVLCSSPQAGKDVRANCTVGCIACKICEKTCEYDAIHVVDNLAVVDHDKCVGCNKCAEKCPMKTIRPSSKKRVMVHA
ncbi:MAG: RnfABCDGE type electron transport complex subunit B [Clostridiales bacterium]|jgi:Na+-translocating ferredoxin:NAD+ oxidoreductase RNF subunit RnfB|nr:RnfABCDGE type electron transport complex subunit B [Clostridiales bacterium]